VNVWCNDFFIIGLTMSDMPVFFHKVPAPTPAEDPVPPQHPSPDETPVPDHNPTETANFVTNESGNISGDALGN
jgi:hypothetical protein